ncbi:hypothetical protein ANO14919_126710 [Xylariales sp. No.14919]|nr:hypothetical protein F5X98DRAFT_355518 [Xylaria grammica]GAW23121.1 hypothetical protein ANO14919_126710 [Xylariales sp. No.14919]
MDKTEQTNVITSVPKHDVSQQPITGTLGDKSGYGVNQDGPAPPTSLPLNMIQEENTKLSNTPVADNVPQVVIEGNPRMVTPLHRLTEDPAWIDCPFCKNITKTSVTKKGDSQQTLAAVICCLIFLPLVCVPGLCGWCENIHIFCSECRREVATIPHDGSIQVMAVGQEQGLVPSKYPPQDGMSARPPPT